MTKFEEIGCAMQRDAETPWELLIKDRRAGVGI